MIMGRFTFYTVLIVFFFGAKETRASFAEIATIMEAVSVKSSFTSAEALQYLQQTTTVLQQDYTNADAELACSVVEGSHIMDLIVDYFVISGTVDIEPLNVAREMASVTALLLRGIGQTFCKLTCDGTCPMSIFQVRPLVTASEDSLLKILRLLIDGNQLDLIEIDADISLFGYKMLVKDVFDKNKIFEVMSIPQTAENLAANSSYSDMTVIFMMISCTENLYSFIPHPFDINGGIYNTYLVDLNGDNVDIFDAIDYFVDSTVNPYDTSNVRSPPINGSENLEATFDFGTESGLVSVAVTSVEICTTSVTSTNTSFDIVTKGLDTIISDGSPSNIDVHFIDQTISFLASPPNPPMDIFINCEACMQTADIIFVIDASGSVGASNFVEMKKFVSTLVMSMQVGSNSVRIGVMTFSTTPSVIFHLDQYYDPTVMVTEIMAAPYTSSATYTGHAMKEVRTSMLPRARNNVQKLVMLLADGDSDDRKLLYSETDSMKADGVEIFCIVIQIQEVDEFMKISSNPNSAYFFKVTNFKLLNSLAGNIMNKICAVLWTNLTSNQIRAGKLSMYVMNSAENQWDISPDVKLKSMEESTVVFESNFFGSFGVSIMEIPPETIDFDNVFTDFDDKIAENPYVIAMNGILLAALVVGTVIMRRFDIEDKRMWQYKPLVDNIDSAAFSYYISVHTGFWSSFRLSSVPYIILKGWYGETLCRPLVDKAGMFRNLIRWRCSNFLLKTDIDIGPLTDVKLWHDNTGVHNNLFLDKILISTGKLGETYVFFCNDWLSDSKGDGKTHRQLFCAQSEFKDGNNVFSSLARFRIFDDHLLLSLFGRPTFSRFSRVQRLYCVAAMLSLSFLASAMSFRSGDNEHVHGMTIGPVKITYKQLYVGIVTSVMTFPVGFLMGYIFRNRRFKQNVKDQLNLQDITKDSAVLPWFTVFIGYGLVGGALANGVFFTTLYSVQWGKDVSTDWLMSILFGTTNGIMFFDPFKVIFFTLIVALVFKGFARKEIEIMAPFYEDVSTLGVASFANVPFYSKWPGDNKESNALAEMRRRIYLDQKLSVLFKDIMLEMLFVALLGLICSHCVITDAYLQNDQLIKQLQPIRKINVTSELWDWMFDKYLPNMNPRKRYNGGIHTPEERKFMSDAISYRMGPIRLRQIRTKGVCQIPDVMEDTILHCSPDLTKETEEKDNFCPGWTAYAKSCDNSGFTYMDSKDTQIFSKLGECDTYGGGGFVRDLNPFMKDIYYDVYTLKRDNWVDNHTRFVSIENVVLNVNTKLFSLVTFDIEIPTVGGYYSKSSVITSRLYPYINSWDYLVLAGQLIFIMLTFIRNVLLIYEAWQMKSKCLKSISFWATVFSILLSYTAIGCYIARIDRTIVIVEKIFNSAGTFMSFELVQLMDDIYKGCLGVVLFIAILNLLKSLTFNYYLYMMKTSIGIAKTDILSFGLMAAIILAGFSSFIYVLMGASFYQFRDFFNTSGTLFRMMLAMVTFRDAELTKNAQSNIIFSFFIFIMAILMVNVFICILNDSFATVKSSWNSNNDIEPFDEELNDHFWWKLGQTFKFCPTSTDPSSKYEKDSSGNVDHDLKQLDHMIGRLFKHATSSLGNGFTH